MMALFMLIWCSEWKFKHLPEAKVSSLTRCQEQLLTFSISTRYLTESKNLLNRYFSGKSRSSSSESDRSSRDSWSHRRSCSRNSQCSKYDSSGSSRHSHSRSLSVSRNLENNTGNLSRAFLHEENKLDEVIDNNTNKNSTGPPNKENISSNETSTDKSQDLSLVPEILEAIGKRLDADNPRAPAIHNDIVVRWEEILQKGLPEEERKTLYKKYLTPENCVFIEPPKLNAEIKATLTDPIINRDKKIFDKQKKLSVCLSAIGAMISSLLSDKNIDPISHLTNLSDIGRILIGVQHDETATRRLIISSNLNPSLKETLNATSADEWLFGKNLADALKTAKSLEKSSKDLKPTARSSLSSAKTSKNTKAPRQQQRNQFQRTGGYRKPTNQMQRSYTRHQQPRKSDIPPPRRR
ncbi:uncharacterized protein LOC122504132 [Leptopilina heterotoma]|uniref:uncharacterized protein LOC122504132 n=1 Tax=Leptopilina heterotoma TaxID=63436 RepID=UPI001CA87F34|nr:uncharacterized protein LOC122504132 [Leptopilina heterotoma]